MNNTLSQLDRHILTLLTASDARGRYLRAVEAAPLTVRGIDMLMCEIAPQWAGEEESERWESDWGIDLTGDL